MKHDILNKRLHLNSTITRAVEDDDDDGALYIEGLASTDDIDRMGDTISHNAWKNGIANFKRNPILLFNHKYDVPIGKAEEVEVTDDGLKIKGRISPAAGGKIIALIKDGVLNTFSVGFMVKDLEYVSDTDGFLIKEAELLEVSVVSVPANASAVFSLAKQLDTETINSLKEGDEPNAAGNPASARQDAEGEAKDLSSENQMTEEEIQALIQKGIKDGLSAKDAEEKAAKERADREAAEKAARKEEQEELVKNIAVVCTENAEKLVGDLEERFEKKFGQVDGEQSIADIVGELKGSLDEHADKLNRMEEKRRLFAGEKSGDWREAFGKDMEDAYILSRATAGRSKEPNWGTSFAKSVMEKVNTHSGIEVSSEDFEQVVSSRIEEDIQNMLVLAPLFNEVQLQSATQILPILPDAGYAEFTSNQTASGTNPHGNLDDRSAAYGANAGISLAERTLSTKKLISRTYLGNETEEDAILPILPLIRRSMVRSHARGVEHALLLGNHADGVYGTAGAAPEGLVTMAAADTNVTQVAGTFAAFGGTTAALLLEARKNMGKYGINPQDVIYIVNQRSWYELLEDPEYQDVQLVGQNEATKLTGEVGRIFGTPVLLCDEFADPAVGKHFALAVNRSNYVVPRLRGVTLESDYETGDQRTVLVASQRLGFVDIIDGSKSVWALQYPAT